MLGVKKATPPRWPTISFADSVKLDAGALTLPLQHAAPVCADPSCDPSPTVSTPLPVASTPPPPLREPSPWAFTTTAAQAERLEGVFAAWEIENRRRAVVKEKARRISPKVKAGWVEEFGVTGGDETVTTALRRWRADLARHRSNAALYPHALGALRVSAHAESFSY